MVGEKSGQTSMVRRFGLGIVVLSFVIAIIAITTYISRAATFGTAEVSFINVGQGDSVLIQDSSGFDALIDGGRSSAGPTVVAYLREQGIDDIDVMIATHPDSDHIGGLIDVLEMADIPVEAVMYNGYEGDTSTWYDFASAVANEGLVMTPAQFPGEYNWGEMHAYILNPASGLVNPDSNDASVVVLLEHGANQFLFTGDIDSTVEATVVARGTPIASDILKVAHHGSSSSSSADFLNTVQPAEAVISVGDNSYGHPTDETLQRLLDAGAQIWRTDFNGTIVVVSDGVAYSISPEVTVDATLVVFLPMLEKYEPPPEPTETPSPPPPSPEPTTPVPTTPPSPDIRIVDIFYDGLEPRYEGDEYAEIQNFGVSVNLSGWRLNAGDPGQNFYFPNYVMDAGQVCRIYTDEYHAEWCGFNFGSGSALWNNSGDCGYLYDGEGQLVSQYCY